MKNRTFVISLLIIGTSCAAFGSEPNRPKVIMQTTFGDIGLELYSDEAPVTAENFLMYVNDGFYDGLVFHRIIADFMIQGGGYTYENGMPFPRATRPAIINESYNGLKNLRGTIAMARYTNPDTATSQFFINLEDNPWLDYPEAWDGIGYCVFGHVISGMDVVDEIGNTPTDNIGFGYTDFPYPEVVYTERVYEPEPEHWLQGDFNNDGIVNFTDFANLASELTAPPTDPNEVPPVDEPENPADDSESKMNILMTFTQNWLSTTDWYE
jgi:cyclophilin family peptidyl-prolyl cis-trans isomerase